MGRLLWVLCAGLFWASPGRSDDSMLLLSETVLPAGVDSPHAMTADADTLFLSSYGSTTTQGDRPASAVSIRQLDMQLMASQMMGAGVNFVENAMQDPTYIYFATQTHPGTIVRLSKAGLALSGNMTVPSGYTVVTMEQDKNYLYLMTFTAPSRILKVRKRDFLAVQANALELQLPPSDRWLITSTSDKYFIYVCTGERPGAIIKVRKQDLKTMGSLTLAANENLVHAIQQDDFYLYAGTQEVPGSVIKIDKLDMTRKATLTLQVGEDLVSAAAQNDKHLFVVTNPTSAPGMVIKVQKSDMARVASIQFAAGNLYPTAAAMSDGGSFMFISLATKPGKILKLSTGPTVDCILSPYSAWSTCTNMCGGGTQFRNRTIVVMPTLHGAACAVLSDVNQCNMHPCPIACKVGGWGPVGPCDVTTGVKLAHRNVLVEPLYGGTACPALQREELCIVDCKVAAWTDWGECNLRRGFRNKTRAVLVKNLNGGRLCPPQIDETACNVDCVVEPWKLWSNCDRERGVKQRSRRVAIMNKHHGLGCPVLTEYQDCMVHCEAGAWGRYAKCITSGLLAGTSRRERPIIRSARNGGKTCTLVEYAKCATSCEVSAWTPWTNCAPQLGSRSRNRTITYMEQNGGDHCPKLADVESCKVDCVLSPWSAWQACDTLVAKQVRERIIEVAPLNGGAPCPELDQQRNCTVDCYVSEWTALDECSAPCDGGTHTRYRVVEIQPAKGGAACPALQESLPCNTHACKPTDCEVTGWSEFTACTKQCGTGTKMRSRSITVPAGKDGEPCPSLKEKQFCNTVPCVEDCSVGDWDDWAPCDTTTGKQKRTRPVLIQPQNGGALCPPLDEERDCDVDCVVSTWTPWSECNAGDAMKERTRTVVTSAKNGGQACPLLQDFDDCGSGCPTSEWTAFSPCSTEGKRTRSRTLTGAQPAGVVCVLEQTVDCVVNCEVGGWMPWSGCSLADGEKKRERSVLVEPKHGGSACPVLVEKENCVVNCLVSAFSTWSACDKASGTQVRTRTVEHEAKNDGTECPALSESKGCMVDCELSLWGAFGACDEAAGLKERTRSILVSALNNGKVCGMLEERDDCGQQCETGPWSDWTECGTSGADSGKMSRTRRLIKAVPGKPCRLKEEATCAISCVVTAFGDWGPCDTAANLKIRVRTVTVPAMNGGSECPTLKEQDTCVVDCKVGPWFVVNGGSEWSLCNKATGKTHRTRVIEVPMENDGKRCPPIREEMVCKVDCLLSDYGEWGACDKDSGLKTRERTIIFNGRNGGTPCGQLTDSTDCLVHCEASQWGTFTACVKSGTKVGTMRRARSVVVTAKNSGNTCALEEEEKCPLDCVLTPWSEWSECNFQFKSQTRARSITSQPLNGGLRCGATSESQACGFTPSPTPVVVTVPTPAPEVGFTAARVSSYHIGVNFSMKIKGMEAAKYEDDVTKLSGEDPEALLRTMLSQKYDLHADRIAISGRSFVGAGKNTMTTLKIAFTVPNAALAASIVSELEKAKAEPITRLQEPYQQLLLTTGMSNADMYSVMVFIDGHVETRGVIDGTSEMKIPSENTAGTKYTSQLSAQLVLTTISVQQFNELAQRVFIWSMSIKTGVEPQAITITGFASRAGGGDHVGGIYVDVQVRTIKAQEGDVAFAMQMISTDATAFSTTFKQKAVRYNLGAAFAAAKVVASTEQPGIETATVGARAVETGQGAVVMEAEEKEAVEVKEGMFGSRFMFMAGGFVCVIVIIAVVAIVIRYRQQKAEKNAFFGELEGEYDEENLLDDEDWAGLDDFGDANFGHDNPMYGVGGGGGGGGGGGEKADNEM
jgi:hypothetical protein